MPVATVFRVSCWPFLPPTSIPCCCLSFCSRSCVGLLPPPPRPPTRHVCSSAFSSVGISITLLIVFVCVSVRRLSLSVSVCLSLSLHLFFSLYVSLSISLSVCRPDCLSYPFVLSLAFSRISAIFCLLLLRLLLSSIHPSPPLSLFSLFSLSCSSLAACVCVFSTVVYHSFWINTK